MAADAIPAAVPGPNDPPSTGTPTGPVSGLLASMLAPVDPARPAFTLTPQTLTDAPVQGGDDVPVTGGSSASYHGDDGTGSDADGKTTTTKSSQQQGIWRAWLLAGADRWKRGGEARNKRLDVQKARAMSLQVKEARTVSVNRTGSLLGNGSKASGAGGKGLDSKSSSGGSGKSPSKGTQKTNGGSGKGSSGRSGGSSGSGSGGGAGRGSGGGSGKGGTSGGTGGGKGAGPSPKGSKGDGDSGSKSPKVSLLKNRKSRDNSGAGKGSGQGPAGGSGKHGASGTGGTSGGSPSVEHKTARETPPDRLFGNKTSRTDKAAADSTKEKAGPRGGTPAGKNNTPASKTAPVTGTPGKDTKDPKSKKDKDGKWSLIKDPKETPGTGPDSTGAKPKADPAKGKPDGKKQPGQATAGGKPFTTRPSRETGYRDGTRVAKTVAHVKAYRDGVQDGYADTAQAADREKARLDKAHQQRKHSLEKKREKDVPVTGQASSADHHPTPQTANEAQPIAVHGIRGEDIFLGAGAERPSITRGEVRSLKHYERRMDAKADAMTKISDITKSFKARADEQAKKATQLLEAARSVKGGEKLIAALTKAQEAAQVQSGRAEEVARRAARGHEGVRAVLSNVETRYGPMYQAVIDSDETLPAELAFHRG